MLAIIGIVLVFGITLCQPQLHTFKINSPVDQPIEEDKCCEGTNATVALSCGIVPRINTQNSDLDNDVAAYGEFPWQVAILDAYEQRFLCSGVLLSHKTVLTAAQCVNHVPTTDLRVRLGDWDILGHGDPREVYRSFEIVVAKKYLNPDAELFRAREDGLSRIALLKLRKYSRWGENPHVSPACLPPPDLVQDMLPTLHCVVAGWSESHMQNLQVLSTDKEACGFERHTPSLMVDNLSACEASSKPSGDNEQQSCLLGKASTHVVSRDDCLHITNDVTPRDASTLCLFPAQDNSHPCQADIGAPVMCEVPPQLRGGKHHTKVHHDDLSPQMVVVGVVTSSFSCSDEATLNKANPVIATSILKIVNHLCTVAGTANH